MNPILQDIYNAGLLPVVTLTSPQQAARLAAALHAAGLTALSVDFHQEEAPGCLQSIAQTAGIRAGAHAIQTLQQAQKAADSGAQFLLTDHFDNALLSWGKERNLPVLPPCQTEEDARRAQEQGLDAVWTCADGGAKTPAAWAEKFPNLHIIVRHPHAVQDAPAYVTLRNVLACAGEDFLAPQDASSEEDFTARAKKAVQHMLGFELRHVGINSPDEKTSSHTADLFETFFGLPKTDRGGAYFAGEIIEVMKKPFYGKYGHIAISTHAPERAVHYLQHAGARFNRNSADYNPDGALRVMYLQDDIGGFAVHILKK